MEKIAVLMDGGHLRVYARKAKKAYVPDIEKFGLMCASADEIIHRILYYDCPPYEGEATQPVTGVKRTFSGSEKFAVRIGVLKFRGFVLKQSRIPFTPSVPLIDSDFEAKFEQKGVDMRIGLTWPPYRRTILSYSSPWS